MAAVHSIRDCLLKLQAFDDVPHAAAAAQQALQRMAAMETDRRQMAAVIASLHQLHALATHMAANLRMGTTSGGDTGNGKRSRIEPAAAQRLATPASAAPQRGELGAWPARDAAALRHRTEATLPGHIDVDEISRRCGFSTNWVWCAVARGWLPKPARRGSSHERTLWLEADVAQAMQRIDFSGRFPQLLAATSMRRHSNGAASQGMAAA